MSGFDFYGMKELVNGIDSASKEDCERQLATCLECAEWPSKSAAGVEGLSLFY